jgi:hypothetical protein
MPVAHAMTISRDGMRAATDADEIHMVVLVINDPVHIDGTTLNYDVIGLSDEDMVIDILSAVDVLDKEVASLVKLNRANDVVVWVK